MDQEGKYLYGASSSGNVINVLDIKTGKVVKSIKVGKEPYGAALSQDGKIVLTGEKGSNQVSVIDTKTLEVKRVISGLNEPRQAIVYSKEAGKAYVLNADLSISVIDYTAGKVIDRIVDKPEAFDMNIKNNSLAISPNEEIAVVSNSTIPGIKVYDLKNKKIIGELDEFVTPRNIAFSKDGKYFYVSDSTYGTIREIDSKTLEVIRTFELKQGVFGFTLTNDGKKIFANNQAESTVTVINLENGKIEKVIEGFSEPRQGIVVDAKDEFVYVTNFKGDDVRVINTKTLKIEKTLEGIPAVRAISVDQDGKYLYGASSSGNVINVLDIKTGKVVKSIKVGKEPYGAALSQRWKNSFNG